MAFKKVSGSVTSLSALFTQVRNFFTSTLGWTQVHSGTQMGSAYYFYHSNGESGSKNIYIGVRSFEYNTLLCGLQFTACTGINTLEDFDSQPGGFGDTFDCYCCQIRNYPLLMAVNDGTSMAYWFIGDKDFAHFLIRVGAKYLSVYVGLFSSYWSGYQLPLIVTSSAPSVSYMYTRCTCGCWSKWQGALPYRYTYDNQFQGGGLYGGNNLWLRNCDNDGWLNCYRAHFVSPTSYGYEWISCVDIAWFLVSNFHKHAKSSRSQGHVLFPIYVMSYENYLLGELKYIYVSWFDDVPSESVIYVGGNPYLVFSSSLADGRDTSIAIRNYE